jgi:hypothetical protein
VSIPTLHITNWSSRKLHGPGRKLTIMAKPRQWEHGDGKVTLLMPAPSWLERVRDGRMPIAEYRSLCEARFAGLTCPGGKVLIDDPLVPGRLLAEVGDIVGRPVVDGDTLCCGCSRDEAAAGRCHRVWAAALLAKAGWRVVLDGVVLP